jgi:thimet oligopeptidase
MRSRSFFRSFIAVSLWLAVQAAVAAERERPLIPLLDAHQIVPLCERGLAGLQHRMTAMEHLPPPRPGDAGQVFADWNQLEIALEDLQGPLEVLNNVSPDPAVRGNAEACLVEISKFATALFQSKPLYLRVKTVQPGDAVDKKLQRDILEQFEDAGVALAPAKQARMKEILEKMEQLSQEFARNIRDNSQRLSFSAAEVQGLPQTYLAAAKRDGKGNYLLGFEYPDYYPFMEYADSSDARRRYYIAYANHGTSNNPPLLQQAAELRLEMARLFGLASYAHYVIRRHMALQPAAVYKFLGEVQRAVGPLEKKELEDLREFKAQTLQQPLAGTRIETWDVSYWQRRLKQARYRLDQNELRKYFPVDAAVPWALQVAGVLYGIAFERAGVPVWHQEVQYYDVLDTHSRERIGGVYLDLFPRDGKYGHAAAFPVRGASTLVQRSPISVLVANFDRAGLSSDEMETLTHELGHVLHDVLSSTRYVSQAGTSGERDFVEAPAQMYEEWTRDKAALRLLSSFCNTPCPTVDAALAQRMTAAHDYGRGMRYARQLLYASFDLKLHSQTTGDALAIWAEMESATPLGHVAGTEFPGQFGHLMDGYAAAYYGYLWSEALALDMLSPFKGKLMNPEIGRLYRRTILARGSEMRGGELMRSFLGRQPDNRAFFDEISGKRLQ